MIYLLGFGIAFAVSMALTPFIRRYALAHDIVAKPDEERKIHTRPVAYMGGLAVFAGFLVAILALVPMGRQLAALLLGCAVLVVVGAIDDARSISPWIKLGWQIVAALIALAGGIGITNITNPFGGVIDLSYGRFAFSIFGLGFHITPIANFISLLWMVGLANTINFLDGLDGLATGVTGIASVILFLLTIGPHVNQPTVALIALILAGAVFGFLPFNFFPAKIFLGDSGAYFFGLVLAMLSIYSGAKLATAVLVLGIPILDTIWAVVRRLAKGKSPFRADRGHFHHILMASGLSQRETVLIFYSATIGFGSLALLVGSFGKLLAISALVALVASAISVLSLVARARARKESLS